MAKDSGTKITTGDMGRDPGKGHTTPQVDGTLGTIASPYADEFNAGDGKAKYPEWKGRLKGPDGMKKGGSV